MIQGGHFSASKGGAQYQAEVLVDALAATGRFDVTYITRNVDPNFKPVGYRIERITTPGWIRRVGFFLDSFQLYRQLTRFQPQVVYQQGLRAHTGVGAWYAARHDARFVFHVASDFDVLPRALLKDEEFSGVSAIDKRLGEYGLRRADRVIAQTLVQSELMQQHYGVEAAAIVRNFHPLPDAAAEAALVPPRSTGTDAERPMRIAWVANFKPVKRPELFVQLAEETAADPRVQYLMIGRPGNPGTYGDLHKRIDALDNLTYLGEVPQERVNAELANCDALINTSIMEGFPNTFIQAWMRGMPVLTVGVNSDRLFDAEDIGYCEDDFAGLKARVLQLAAAPELRAQLGEQSRRYALANHSMGNVDALIKLLES